MNNPMHAASRASAMGLLSRRAFVSGVTTCAVGWSGRAQAAAPDPLPVVASSAALGAVAAAIGGNAVHVTVDPALEGGKLRLGPTLVDATRGLLLKGQGAARARFLDDGRNATKVGKRIRDALVAALPAQATSIQDRHRAWSRDLAKQVLRWDLALRNSSLRGKRISDPHGRRYLLEWAGATFDPTGRPGPASLAKLPPDASEPTPAGYRKYLGQLVAAVA